MIYVDTSALLKLVWDEDESVVLRRYLAGHDRALISSVLVAVETRRSVLPDDPGRLPRADVVLANVVQVAIGDAVVESASRLPDQGLRSLDAIHVATALLLRPEIDAVLTYDKRFATAAASHGLSVVSPA